jgi:hypothetical protein
MRLFSAGPIRILFIVLMLLYSFSIQAYADESIISGEDITSDETIVSGGEDITSDETIVSGGEDITSDESIISGEDISTDETITSDEPAASEDAESNPDLNILYESQTVNTINLSINGRLFENELILYNDKAYINREMFNNLITGGDIDGITKSLHNLDTVIDVTNADEFIIIDSVRYGLLRNFINPEEYNIYWEDGTKTVYADSRKYLLGLINAVEVEAKVLKAANVYSSPGSKKIIDTCKKGSTVVLLKQTNLKWAQIKYGEVTGWISYNALSISNKNYSDKEEIKPYIKEFFVNNKNYTSDTDYLIWINLEREDLNVFKKSSDAWKLEKAFKCSSGKNKTLTVSGVFKYYAFVNRINFDGFYIKNFMRFNGPYGIHTILIKPNGSVYDGRVGIPLSHGCVRVETVNSEWLKDNIPLRTTIVVY